ncbi:MAG: PilZ domain-containing protein [Hyphomicrobiales bacterium]|nr:PilZ domain-containing protein [Hyphomicrobiales bacterium]
MASSLTGSKADKRNARRHRLRLSGRYMLVDRSEWVCETIDISPAGVLLLGMARPYPGQTVVVYLEEIGRLEGTVVRLKPCEFALHIRATDRKREQLAALLSRLAEGEATPRRVHPAILGAVGQSSAPAQAYGPEHGHEHPVSGTQPARKLSNPYGAFRIYLDSL